MITMEVDVEVWLSVLHKPTLVFNYCGSSYLQQAKQ